LIIFFLVRTIASQSQRSFTIFAKCLQLIIHIFILKQMSFVFVNRKSVQCHFNYLQSNSVNAHSVTGLHPIREIIREYSLFNGVESPATV